MQITVTGMKGDQLRRWAANLRKAKAPITAMLAYMHTAIYTKAQSGMDVDGKPYRQYSENYRAWFTSRDSGAAFFMPNKTWMYNRGEMLAAMKQKADNHKGVLGYWGGNKQTWKALLHQQGGSLKRGAVEPKKKKALWWPGLKHPVRSVKEATINIPARKWFGFRQGDKEACNKIFQNWVVLQCMNTGLVIKGSGGGIGRVFSGLGRMKI